MSSVAEAGAALGKLIAQADRIVAFTGAGISTESGVPDFRSPGSPWLRHAPIDYAEFIADPDKRAEAWRRKFAMDDIYAGAKPARGHLALKSLVDSGKMSAVITQNIDGLHQQSGIPDERIIELHGNGTYAHCLSCGGRHELADVRRAFEATDEAPLCACGGFIKSATVSFGQSMPEEAMARARAETLACDLFIAIGSSLVVHPAAAFPRLAQQAGAILVIVNRDATPLDGLADLVLRGDIGDILEPSVRLADSA
jgi:NAD-dependent deacetylase